jgi:hypothetical protein
MTSFNHKLARQLRWLKNATNLVILWFPGDKLYDQRIAATFGAHDVPGLKICHAYWPRACIDGFVTYPSHQERPTQEQLDDAAARIFIEAVKDSQRQEESCKS